MSKGRGLLTIQLLYRHHVVPAEQQVAAAAAVVGRHEGVADGRVLQAQCVAHLVGCHQEEVVPLVAAEGPTLGPVKVGLAAAGQEGMGQRPTWGSPRANQKPALSQKLFSCPSSRTFSFQFFYFLVSSLKKS